MSESLYTIGGTIPADNPLYIDRRADTELLGLCRTGEYAYILTSRQLGKSSLMLRTSLRLGEEGVRSAIVDLQRIGKQATAIQWYGGVLREIAHRLRLDEEFLAWWQQHEDLGMAQRVALFFEELALVHVSAPLVIFVDEIDTTIGLDYTDDFFITIRGLYEGRTQNSDLKRLSFVLIGTASPSDLIRDPKRTPFNIGRRVDLSDFAIEEAAPLAEALGLPPKQAGRVLQWVFEWTNGQPYLTQRLCRAIAAQKRASWSKADVNALVWGTFFGDKSREDANLGFVRNMLLKAPEPPGPALVLATYQQIRDGSLRVPDEEQSPVKSHLKLSGIVRRHHGTLRVRNRIYDGVFDNHWINEHLPTSWPQRLRRARRIAMAIIVPLFFVAVVLAGLAGYFALNVEGQRQMAVAEKAIAESRRQEAETARAQADLQKATAVAAAANERTARQAAEAARATAERLKNGAVARQLAFAARTAPDPQEGLLLAIEAATTDPETDDVQTALRDTLRSSHVTAISIKQSDELTGAAFNPDGRCIAAASRDGTALVWNDLTHTAALTLTGHTQSVSSIVFSPDGKTILTGSEDNTARIWDATTGKTLHILSGHAKAIYSAAFSPDGRRVVTASGDGTARVWNAATGYSEKIFPVSMTSVFSATFSPDGAYIVTASRDKTVRIWNVQSGKLESSYPHDDWVYSAVFSPDGRQIATASADYGVRIWDVGAVEPSQLLRGHAKAVYSVAFSPDGKYLVSASADKTARVWDTLHDTSIITLTGHTDRVWSATFSPDGKQVVTASRDGTARVWEAHTPPEVENPPPAIDALLALARQRVTRQLTDEERQRFGLLQLAATPMPASTVQGITATPIPAAVQAATPIPTP